MENLLVFETYFDKEQALRTAATLENNGIFVAVEENLSPLDSNFIGQQFNNPYSVKIPGSQFEKAGDILLKHTIINLDEVEPDYILMTFSNEELKDVLKNKKEWGVYNYKLAEKLLEQRGVSIIPEVIAKAQMQKQYEEAQPKQYDIYWIVIGYLMALLTLGAVFTGFYSYIVFAFPSLFALVIGFMLFSSKKTLTDGSRVYIYNKTSRLNGLMIFLIAVTISIIRIFGLIKYNGE